MDLQLRYVALGPADDAGAHVAFATALDVTVDQLRSRAAAHGVRLEAGARFGVPALRGLLADGTGVFAIHFVDVRGDGAQEALGERAGLREAVAAIVDLPATHLAQLFVDGAAIARILQPRMPALREAARREVAVSLPRLAEQMGTTPEALEPLLLSDAAIRAGAADTGVEIVARLALAQLAVILDWAVDVGLRDGETSTWAFNLGDAGRPVFARGDDALRVLLARADIV